MRDRTGYLKDRITGEQYFDENDERLEELFDDEDKKLTMNEKIERNIKRAGSKLKVNEYYSMVAISAFAIFTFSLVIFHGQIIMSFLFSGFGVLIPHYYLKTQYKKKVKKFNEQLIDTLRTISSSLRGGLSLEQAIENLANNAPSPTKEEFRQVHNDLELGRSLEESLESLRDRIDDKDMDLIITVIFIQRQIGGNLTKILDSIAKTIEDRVKLKQEIKALTSQGKLSAFIMGGVPIVMFLAINLINPNYLDALFESEIGPVLLGLAVVLDVVGTFLAFKLAQPQVSDF